MFRNSTFWTALVSRCENAASQAAYTDRYERHIGLITGREESERRMKTEIVDRWQGASPGRVGSQTRDAGVTDFAQVTRRHICDSLAE